MYGAGTVRGLSWIERSQILTARSAIRSRSVTILSVMVMKRRSLAIGWRQASNAMHIRSSSTSSVLT